MRFIDFNYNRKTTGCPKRLVNLDAVREVRIVFAGEHREDDSWEVEFVLGSSDEEVSLTSVSLLYLYPYVDCLEFVEAFYAFAKSDKTLMKVNVPHFETRAKVSIELIE